MTDLLSALREFRTLEDRRAKGALPDADLPRWKELRAALGPRAPLLVPPPPESAAELPPLVEADEIQEVASPAPVATAVPPPPPAVTVAPVPDPPAASPAPAPTSRFPSLAALEAEATDPAGLAPGFETTLDRTDPAIAPGEFAAPLPPLEAAPPIPLEPPGVPVPLPVPPLGPEIPLPPLPAIPAMPPPPAMPAPPPSSLAAGWPSSGALPLGEPLQGVSVPPPTTPPPSVMDAPPGGLAHTLDALAWGAPLPLAPEAEPPRPVLLAYEPDPPTLTEAPVLVLPPPPELTPLDQPFPGVSAEPRPLVPAVPEPPPAPLPLVPLPAPAILPLIPAPPPPPPSVLPLTPAAVVPPPVLPLTLAAAAPVIPLTDPVAVPPPAVLPLIPVTNVAPPAPIPLTPAPIPLTPAPVLPLTAVATPGGDDWEPVTDPAGVPAFAPEEPLAPIPLVARAAPAPPVVAQPTVILGPEVDLPAVAPTPPAAPDRGALFADHLVPASAVAGEHRVVIHMLAGTFKRGALRDPDLESGELELFPQKGGQAERIPVNQMKAIFFMLGPGDPPPKPEGKKVKVTFEDARELAGYRLTGRDSDPGFFLIPADPRANAARIYVFRAAVRGLSEQ